MAIAKVVYKENASATPEVWMDTTQKTVTSGTMLSGTTALKNDGTGITGNIASKSSSDLTASGATVTAPAGYYPNAASKSVETTTHPNPTASINATTGVVTATHTQTAGYVAAGTTTGTLLLTTQAAKTVAPTESEQTAVSAGVYTTGAVKVGAISSTYVGSDVAQNDSSDLTASGATVTAPAGYYDEAASKSVASGIAGTPTVTKGTVSNHSISVTPSVTNTTGYITGGTKNGTAVTVNVSELESGTKTITENGTGISVSGYSAVDVDVPGQVPTGVKYIYTDIDGVNAYNVSGFEKVSVNYAGLQDDKFRLWVETTEANTTFSFSINTDNRVSCHAVWGDGGEEDFYSAGTTAATVVGTGYSKTVSHIYATAGRYCAVISSIGNLIGGIQCQNNSYLKGVEIASYIDKWYTSNYFVGCANLESITFPENNTDITTTPSESICRNLPSLKRVVFNSPVSSIPCFASDVSLEELTLPATIGVIAGFTFDGCTMLRRINGFDSASITSLSQYMFRNCSSLLSVTIPQSVITMFNSVFNGSAIKSITIPQSVTDLGRYTFQNCTYLKEVHLLPTTPPTIYAGRGTYYDPFKNTHPDLVLYVPQGYLSAYQNATNWSSYASIMQEE